VVQAPTAGETVVIKAMPGQDIVLSEAFEQAEPVLEGSTVLYDFDNGGKVVIDFAELGDVQLPSIVLADGTVLDVQEFLASLGGEIEPAAGPAAGATGSGGVGEYGDDAGDIIAGVDKLGGLDPRDFTSTLVEPLEASNLEVEPVPSAGVTVGAVDEDGLESGNPGGLGDHPAELNTITGNLAYSFGDDGPSASTPFSWSLDGLSTMGVTSQGNTVLYEVADDGLTLNAYYVLDGGDQSEGGRVEVFSVTLDDLGSGAYTFVLFQPLDHGVAGTEDDILYNLGFTVTDGDGDTADGTLVMTVDDDTPIWQADSKPVSAVVNEDGLPEGNSDGGDVTEAWGPSGSLASFISFGADGPGSFSLITDTSSLPDLYSNGVQIIYSVTDGDSDGLPDTLTATAGEGGTTVFVLTLEADGSWHFDLQEQLDHVDDANAGTGQGDTELALYTGAESAPVSSIDFSSVIQVTDFDGDPLSGLENGSFTVSVENDVPVVSVDINYGEEQDVLGGIVSDETTDLGIEKTASAPVVDINILIGADDDGATTNVALVIDEASSGLMTTAGKAITLVAGETDNEVLGVYDSDGDTIADSTAFKISVSDGGVLSVTQFVSLQHPDTSNPDDAVSLDGKISIQVSAEDGDGDVASASQPIGAFIVF
jgi:T1SS-143 domain-containing protein